MAVPVKKLSEQDVLKRLSKFPEWSTNAKRTEITKSIATPSFLVGLGLTAKIAVHAEIMNHHPLIELTYGGVKIRLSTHDVKGLTKLDFDLARRIDNLKIR
ncbi:MAG: 4a-hydroxytetrahydrobiopterin dehydratase [Candidatus Kaiserbacteria bacterium]|nr:4a-hydroxytetrahydrobiopterin dehydratase [Candidatus Kaiserbacteria bacterium]